MATSLNIASRLAAIAATEKPTPKPAPANQSDLAWDTMDVETLPRAMQEQFYALLKAQEAEREARKAISVALVQALDLPPNLTVRVAAKWGKLSVAIDNAKRATSGKPALSLADLVALADKRVK